MRKLAAVLLAIVLLFGLSSPAFAASSHASEARAVLQIVNEERKAAGLEPLEWESSLVSYATTRARESSQLWSHTRPNGKSSMDYPGANGENLAYGTIYTAEEVMDGWMNSPPHRENILYEHFTGLAVACVEMDNGYYYWCQIFHSEKRVTSDGTVIDPRKTGDTGKTSAASDSTDSSAVSASSIIASLNKSNTGSATLKVSAKNKRTISPSAIGEIAKWASNNKKAVQLTVNTTFTDTKAVQGQFTFKPAEFTALKNNLKLGVYTESEKVSAAKQKLNKWYSNNIAVVRLEQAGALGGTVKIAVKADLSKLDTKKLVFYVYNSSNSKISQISKPNYSIDKNGFLHFYTNTGGYIVITDKALAKKK